MVSFVWFVLALAFAPVTPGTPITIAPYASPAAAHDPTALELAKLYTAVGRELSALEAKSSDAAIDLWPRYRWIRINDALLDPNKRRQAFELLGRIRRDVASAASR